MKKLISTLLAGILIAAIAVAAPAGAGVKYIFQADLEDNTGQNYPAVLNAGEVTIDPDFVARVQIRTDSINQTYGVVMHVGGGRIGSNVPLGSITTDVEGNGKATFDLKSYQDRIATPRIIGPAFSITSPGKEFPEFDTSYLAFPDHPVPAKGRIIVAAGAPGDTATTFDIYMSYGYPIGYPDGAHMNTGFSVDSDFTLAPGIYTINEYYKSSFNLSQININDPTRDSLRSGRTAIVNLAPGETVTVQFVNTQVGP